MADILKIARDFNPKKALTHIFDKIDEIIGRLNILWRNDGNAKVYKALLTQTGTNAPVATVLVNTLSGTPVLSRASAGNYKMTLASEFIHDKTYVYGMIDYYDFGQSLIPIYSGGSIIGYYSIFITDPNSIDIAIFDATFASVDLSTLIGASSICLPPIEVYP